MAIIYFACNITERQITFKHALKISLFNFLKVYITYPFLYDFVISKTYLKKYLAPYLRPKMCDCS